MALEPIGAVTLLAGLLIFFLRESYGFYALAIANVFGAAAVAQLPALGGASVPPAPFILLFVAGAALLHPQLRTAALTSLTPPKPGAWYLAVVAYGALTAVFLPRIFAGMTDVFSLARSGPVGTTVNLPLAPQSGNITQSAYFIGDVVCFALVAGYARLGHSATLMRALAVTAGLCLFFAAADVVTYVTHTADILQPIRNANYRMLDDGAIGGIKRIVGSFPEASAYSYMALGLYAFTLSLWLAGREPRVTGSLAGLLGLTLVLSTSTTAYAALVIFTLIVLTDCLVRLKTGQATRQQFGFAAGVVVGVPFMILTAIVVLPSLWTVVSNLIDATVVNKLDSQSGVERMRWNEYALRSFFDTGGLGAGLGSVRASSFLVAILANMGLLGLLLYMGFLVSIVVPGFRVATATLDGAISRAAASACLALVVAASISGGGVDLGLTFSMFAGLAAGARERVYAPAAVLRRRPAPQLMAGSMAAARSATSGAPS
jgi:hypothetical protein